MWIIGTDYWVPEPVHVWVAAKCIASDPTNSTFENADVGKFTLPTKPKAGITYIPVNATEQAGVPDIAMLTNASEASMLATCRKRYFQDDIYTYVGKILIAMNPFRALPITGKTWIDKYRHATLKEPHIYGIGRMAFDSINEGNGSQAIMIAGESGAGKTETAKLVFGYISVCGGGTGIESRVMQVNPILEAFGNAKTVRNDNSSRFGKWTQLAINKGGMIESALIKDYLLEMSRVCGQTSGERGYHIFYMLLKNNPQKYGFTGSIEDYSFLSGGGIMEKFDEIDEFQDFSRAALDMGMTQAEIDEVLHITASVLHFGNIKYEAQSGNDGNDFVQIVDLKPLRDACIQFGISSEEDIGKLADVLTTKELKIGGDITKKNLSMKDAIAARDSVAKFLYGRTFKWIVARLNTSLQEGSTYDESMDFIGVLDIAGFETFETNSLEQLFINLSNEELQGIFNAFVFENEVRDYEAEGITLQDFTFNDNKAILETIKGKGGLLSLLDESLKVPQPSDAKFLNRANQALSSNTVYIKNRFNKPFFTINHYAGVVEYTVEGFLAKNKEYAPDLACLESSSLDLMKSFDLNLEKKTISSKFTTSLGELMTKLRSALPHFVRCIKPNQSKKPQIFEAPSCLEQLKNAGVLEAIRIRQMGFPMRYTFKEFMLKYLIIFPTKYRIQMRSSFEKNPKQTIVDAISELCKTHGFDWGAYYSVGHNKIMFKVQVEETIMELRNAAYDEPVRTIQRVYRGFVDRSRTRAMRTLLTEIKAFLSTDRIGAGVSYYDHCGSDAAMEAKMKTVVGIVERSEELGFDHHMISEMNKIEDKFTAELQVLEQIKALEDSTSLENMQTVLAKAMEMGLKTGIVENMGKAIVALEKEKAAAIEAGMEWTDNETMESFQKRKSIHKQESMQLEAALGSPELTSETDEHEAKETPVDGLKKFVDRVKNKRRPRLSITCETQWDRDIKDAVDTCDFQALDKMLQEAKSWNLQSNLVTLATQEFDNLNADAYVKLQMARLICTSNHDRLSIKRMRNLRKLAEERRLDELKTLEPLNSRLRKKRFSICNDDGTLIKLKPNDAHRIDKCDLLKPQTQRKGLHHSRVPIKQPLTHIQDKDTAHLAVQMFYNVMTAMHDYPMCWSRQVDVFDEIRFYVTSYKKLVDEVYVQIVKQLIGNQDPHSVKLGYGLLNRYAECFEPSAELQPYVQSYIDEAATRAEAEKEGKRASEAFEREQQAARRQMQSELVVADDADTKEALEELERMDRRGELFEDEAEASAQSAVERLRAAKLRITENKVSIRERKAQFELDALRSQGNAIEEAESSTKTALERLREAQENIMAKQRMDAIEARYNVARLKKEQMQQVLVLCVILLIMCIGLTLLPQSLWTPTMIMVACVIIAASYVLF